jgi:hypothetical protein
MVGHTGTDRIEERHEIIHTQLIEQKGEDGVLRSLLIAQYGFGWR